MVQAMQQAIEKHHPLPITLEDSMETMAIIDRLFYPKTMISGVIPYEESSRQKSRYRRKATRL